MEVPIQRIGIQIRNKNYLSQEEWLPSQNGTNAYPKSDSQKYTLFDSFWHVLPFFAFWHGICEQIVGKHGYRMSEVQNVRYVHTSHAVMYVHSVRN